MGTVTTRFSVIQYLPRPETHEFVTVGVLADPGAVHLPDALVFADDVGFLWSKGRLGNDFARIATCAKEALQEWALDNDSDLFEAANGVLDDRFRLSETLSLVTEDSVDAVLDAVENHVARIVTAVARRRAVSDFGRRKLRLTHRFRGWLNQTPFKPRLERKYRVRIPGRQLVMNFDYGAVSDETGLLLDLRPLGSNGEDRGSDFIVACRGRVEYVREWKPNVRFAVLTGERSESEIARSEMQELHRLEISVIEDYKLATNSQEYEILANMQFNAA